MGREARTQRIAPAAPLTATPDGWVHFDQWPIWHVQIMRSAADTASADLPALHSPLRVDMLVDTGSNITLFAPLVWSHIGVRRTGEQLAAVTGGAVRTSCDEYFVDLALFMTVPEQPYVLFQHVKVYEQPVYPYEGTPRPPHNGILGMDLLRACRFTLDGPAGLFKLEQPAR